jgi:hypothetical protein
MTSRWVGVKRQVEAHPPRRCSEFEHVGEMVRRLRRQCESEMTNEFCPHLSLRLDLYLVLEQHAEEGRP